MSKGKIEEFLSASAPATRASSQANLDLSAYVPSGSLAPGENIGAGKMPNDDNREMLTEVVALYLAAHMKAQAAVTTALVAILIQKGF